MRILRQTTLCGTLLALAFAGVTVWAQTQQKTPSQFYMDYRAAVDKAGTLEEILPYLSTEIRQPMETIPAAQRPRMLQAFKAMRGSVTNFKVVKEIPTGNGATLNVEGLNPEQKKTMGTIQIVKEQGQWKIGKEDWPA